MQTKLGYTEVENTFTISLPQEESIDSVLLDHIELSSSQVDDKSEPFSILPKSAYSHIKQPKDGNCLYHALSYSYNYLYCSLATSAPKTTTKPMKKSKQIYNAKKLRQEITTYIQSHGSLLIHGIQLKDWINYDSQQNLSNYSKHMKTNHIWGGSIELIVFSYMKNISIEIYEDYCMDKKMKKNYYHLMSRFKSPVNPDNRPVIYLLFNGSHYGKLTLVLVKVVDEIVDVFNIYYICRFADTIGGCQSR